MLPPRPVIGILHPGAMGAAVGNALKPVAGAVIWAAAGRSLTTSKRAETADLVGVPDVAELARRADVVISVCPPDAARAVAEEVARADSAAPGPALRRRQRGVARHGHRHRRAASAPSASSTGRSSARPRGSRAARSCGWPGPRRPPSPRCSRARRSRRGCWRARWASASALKACFALQSKALPTLWVQLDAAARAYGVSDEIREELHRTGVDLDARLAGHRRAGQGQGLAMGGGDAGGGRRRSPRWACPTASPGRRRETYERMAAADPTDRANPWGLRGPAER